jgi:hypothetical protein
MEMTDAQSADLLEAFFDFAAGGTCAPGVSYEVGVVAKQAGDRWVRFDREVMADLYAAFEAAVEEAKRMVAAEPLTAVMLQTVADVEDDLEESHGLVSALANAVLAK